MDFDIVREIESEFGEPIQDIIDGMRQMGYKWGTIAGALEVDVLTLRRWRRELGMRVSKSDVVSDAPRRCKKDVLAERHGYETIQDLLWDWRINKDMMAQDVAKKLGVTVCTISRWSPEEIRQHTTEGRREASRRNVAIAREGVGNSSPWMREKEMWKYYSEHGSRP